MLSKCGDFGARIYAVTKRNRWIGGVLSCLIVAQFATGIYLTVYTAVSPSKPLFFILFSYGFRTFLVPNIPVVDYEPFEICGSVLSKVGNLIFVNMGVGFGTLPLPYQEF